MIRDIFNDGIYSLINKIGYFGAKTIAIILITRTLGVDEGSQFIFLISIIEIMRVIGDFGVDVYVIRKYGDVPNKERLLCTVFYQKIIVGFVFAAILIVYCSILKYNASIYVPLSLSIIFSLLFNLSSSYFQSLNINKAITTSIISASIFIGVLFSSFYYFNVVVNAYHFLVIEIVYCMSVSFTLINKTDLKIIRQFKKVDISAILYLYRNTYSIGITALIVIIYSRLDNIYLKLYDEQSLAVYGQIFRFVDPLVMISSVFSTVAYAKFSNFKLHNNEASIKSFLLMIVIYILVSFLIYYYVLISIWQWFILPTSLFKPLLIGFLCMASIKCMNGSLTAILQSQGLYKIGLYISILCIIIAVPLMYVFVKHYHALGCIYAVLIVETVSFIFLSASVYFLTSNRNHKDLNVK